MQFQVTEYAVIVLTGCLMRFGNYSSTECDEISVRVMPTGGKMVVESATVMTGHRVMTAWVGNSGP